MNNKIHMRTDYLTKICKIGQGAACCRYIVAGGNGISCAKLTGLKTTIDQRVADGKFTATSDNCEGKDEKVILTKEPLP